MRLRSVWVVRPGPALAVSVVACGGGSKSKRRGAGSTGGVSRRRPESRYGHGG